jgi:hypothetical protein
MDFTAGLMPLDTALTQMLNRITPLQRDGNRAAVAGLFARDRP